MQSGPTIQTSDRGSSLTRRVNRAPAADSRSGLLCSCVPRWTQPSPGIENLVRRTPDESCRAARICGRAGERVRVLDGTMGSISGVANDQHTPVGNNPGRAQGLAPDGSRIRFLRKNPASQSPYCAQPTVCFPSGHCERLARADLVRRCRGSPWWAHQAIPPISNAAPPLTYSDPDGNQYT